MLAFVLRAMKMKWNKTRTHHRFDFTLCISENRQFVLQTTKYVLLTLPLYANTFCLLRIRICEFIIITFTNRKKNMNAEAEIEKNENKNQNNNMSMHVNKISIICCWFFGKHGVRTRYLSVFILIKLQFFLYKKKQELCNGTLSMYYKISDRCTDYSIKIRFLVDCSHRWKAKCMEFFVHALKRISDGRSSDYYSCKRSTDKRIPWNQIISAYRYGHHSRVFSCFVHFNVKRKKK